MGRGNGTAISRSLSKLLVALRIKGKEEKKRHNKKIKERKTEEKEKEGEKVKTGGTEMSKRKQGRRGQ